MARRARTGTANAPGGATTRARDRWRATTRAKALGASPERREAFATTSEHRRSRPLHARRPRPRFDPDARPRPARASTRSPAASSRRCTAAGSGRCASTPASRPRPRRTSGSATCSTQGQTGLSVAFDLPTQMGYDSDAPEAEGEVGRVGVPIAQPRRHGDPARGLPLGEVSTSMTINATAPILLALYVAAAEKQGVAAVGGLAARPRTTSSRSTSPAGRTSTRRARRCGSSPTCSSSARRELPRWNTISICGYHMREAGATAAQELAFTLADAIAYVDAAVARGLDVDDFAGRLSFFFAAWTRAVRGGRQVPGRPPDVGADHARAVRRDRTRSR